MAKRKSAPKATKQQMGDMLNPMLPPQPGDLSTKLFANPTNPENY